MSEEQDQKENEVDREILGGWFGRNRLLCDVLDDMRLCDKSRNYSALKGLIEEAQIYGNRMEQALQSQKDILKLETRISELKRDHRQLKNISAEVKVQK